MKKIIMIVITLITITGCTLSNIDNTPTKQVETFFNNYQTLDQKVLDDLDLVVNKKNNYTQSQKEEYRKIMKTHYQNLTYEIKDEKVNGDRANVEVEIEVTDYTKTLKETNNYLLNHKEEFNDETGNYNESKYIDYQLDKIKDTKETVKYTLNLTLTKEDKKWILEQIDEIEEKKILGIYEY